MSWRTLVKLGLQMYFVWLRVGSYKISKIRLLVNILQWISILVAVLVWLLFWAQEWRHFLAHVLQLWLNSHLQFLMLSFFNIGRSWPLLTKYKAWKWWQPWYVAVATLSSRLAVSCSSAGRVSLLTPVSKNVDADVALVTPNIRFF